MLRRWWNQYRRTLDRRILWPVCKEQAPDLETARQMMRLHAALDPAWADLSEAEVVQVIWHWS
jgi:hypothetical protein